MSTKKGNDDDDSYNFDPLEALADVVLGDAFTFFDEPAKAVEKATNGTDTGTSSKDASVSGQSGSDGEGRTVKPTKSTIKPLPAPTAKGKAPGEQKQAEGGNAADGDKESDGEKEPTAS